MLGVTLRSYSHASNFTFNAVLFVCFCCVTDIVHIEHAKS